MFASLRHEGKSIGEVIKANIGTSGKKLFNLFGWLTLVLGVAAFTDICASIMPVWILLQPRDYLCSFLLYAMLIGGVLGIIIMRPEIVMPAFTGFVVGEGASTKFLFPMLFITVVCGTVSGFHSLVSSGTSSKQIKNEKDTKLIGYGAMLIEGFVAVIAIIAVAYIATPGTGTPVQQFSAGLAYFMSGFGLPQTVGQVFVTLVFSAFALTSLDTATRIVRYMFQKLVSKEQSET